MTFPEVTTVVPVGGPVTSQRDPDSRCGEAPVLISREEAYTARMKVPFALLVAAVALPAQAEIFRCTAAGGAVTYQEIPCGGADKIRTMDIPAVFPEVNSAERERLLQREAALEVRMLERERIESNERIARNELAVREREARAARDAAAAAQGYSGVYGGLWPVYRQPFVRHQGARSYGSQRF